MDLATIAAIREELEAALAGRRFGKIFQLSRTDLVIDFRLHDSRYLFLSAEPRNPRAFLIKRKLRDLEKSAGTPSTFALTLRKKLSGAEVSSVRQLDHERVLVFSFDAEDELGGLTSLEVVGQLTGASANLFLLDSASVIVAAMRQTLGAGQQIGERYEPPARRNAGSRPDWPNVVSPVGLSERLDAEDLARQSESSFQSLITSARAKLKQETSRREKLLQKLSDDLENHGDADRWKRFGDLLLASTTSGRRDGDKVFVTDFFDEAAPQIAISVDENDSVTEAAEKYFRKYTKARNARQEIEKRREVLAQELQHLADRNKDLEDAISAEDEDRIREISGMRAAPRADQGKKRQDEPSGMRTFLSSDGFEILVGKKAKDNDLLTFRVAKSLDTWMHAADYPGSHVVVRNPNRKEIPHRTLVEAAELAAFYSQGKKQPKAAVHYTQKKFVNKPKGAAAGLVSLASFKTLLVEPKVGIGRKI